MVFLWLALFLAFLAAEAATTAFFAMFVALGALGALVVAAVGADVWVQAVVFAAVAAAGVAGLRPLVADRLHARRLPAALPGAQGPVGQTAMTLDVVGDEHHPGHALLGGERWLAVTDSSDSLPPDHPVIVIGVHGTTLHVVSAEPHGSTAS